MTYRSSTVGSTTGGSSVTCTKPAGVAEGDLLIFALSSGGSASPTTTWPSGFTEQGFASHTGSAQRLRYATKVATASEPADYTVTFSPSDHASGALMAYSAVTGIATARSTSGALTGAAGANPTPMTAPTFDTPEANCDVIWIGAGYPSGATTITGPSGFTGRNGTSTQYSNIAFADKVQSAAGATGAMSGSLGAGGYPLAVAFALPPGSIAATPVITSNGGGGTAAISVAENTTAVTTVTATDANSDPITFSISGGADSAKFSINSSTGVLTFVSAPDFESPTDADANNVYVVIVRASDGALYDEQTISVTVTDVAEAAPAADRTFVWMH